MDLLQLLAPILGPVVLPTVVAAVLGLVAKAVHAGGQALVRYLDSKTSDTARQAAFQHLADTADTVVAQVEANLKPTLTEEAGELLATGKLSPAGAAKLKAAAVAQLKAQAPVALDTLKEVEGLGVEALEAFVNGHVEAAVSRLG